MKNQNGITIVMLVVTIIVLIIITSMTVYIGSDIIKRVNLQSLNTNMLLLQAKTKTLAEEAKFNNDNARLKGIKVSEISNNEKIKKLIDEFIIEDQNKYYLLSQEDLNSMGLEKMKIEDGYLVNYETDEIIYVKGFEANKTTYYKLSETKEISIE